MPGSLLVAELTTVLATLFVTVFAVFTAACARDVRAIGRDARGEGLSRPQVFTGRSEGGRDPLVLVELASAPMLARFPDAKRGRLNSRAWRAHADLLAREQDAFLARLFKSAPGARLEHRYVFTLNGLAVRVPSSERAALEGLPGSLFSETAGAFARPAVVAASSPPLHAASSPPVDAASSPPLDVSSPALVSRRENGVPVRNPVAFVGAHAAHARGLRGRGVRIGIVDTGVDYRHVALGGIAHAEPLGRSPVDDPAFVEPGTFPTAKVVGGADLVGTRYDALSPHADFARPEPDSDPMDEGFHGTHVAALAAGVPVPSAGFAGGVAPEASLFVIKVFGREGGTDDGVLLAALEKAADPNGDGLTDDVLPIVNFSLGSRYGTPSHIHERAVRTLSRAGTLVVAAAGNDGQTPFVVGSPATVEEALAVGASVDDSDWNWRARAVTFGFPAADGAQSRPPLFVRAVEGETTRALAGIPEAPPVDLIDLGEGTLGDFGARAEAMRGKVVLVDRGGLSFDEKIRRVQDAGGVGVVVVNVDDDEPFRMGGDGDFAIPGIMVEAEVGSALREALSTGVVVVDFTGRATIDSPGAVDVVAPFSSRGPRAQDALLKPDIVAPGLALTSAVGGSSAGFTLQSGSSMASPLVAGAAALLAQAFPEAHPGRLKARLMNSARVLGVDATARGGARFAPSEQGAGRLDVSAAIAASTEISPASVTLSTDEAGGFGASGEAHFALRLSNQGIEARVYTFALAPGSDLTLEAPASVLVDAGAALIVSFVARVSSVRAPVSPTGGSRTPRPAASEPPSAPAPRNWVERFGFLRVRDDAGGEVGVPVTAPAFPRAGVVAAARDAGRGSLGESVVGIRPAATTTYRNTGARSATLARFPRWYADDSSPSHGPCDLSGVALRLREGRTLEAAFILRRPLSTLSLCEPSLLIDVDDNGTADYELTGMRGDRLSPSSFGSLPSDFSFLLDAPQAQSLRAIFDATWRPGAGRAPDFGDALIDLQDVAGDLPGTVVTLKLDLGRVPDQKPFSPSGRFRFAAVLAGTAQPAARPDDFLDGDNSTSVGGLGSNALPPWLDADFEELSAPVGGTDAVLAPGEEIRLPAGDPLGALVVPENAPSRNVLR
jgi:subtilisin family serine protease